MGYVNEETKLCLKSHNDCQVDALIHVFVLYVPGLRENQLISYQFTIVVSMIAVERFFTLIV